MFDVPESRSAIKAEKELKKIKMRLSRSVQINELNSCLSITYSTCPFRNTPATHRTSHHYPNKSLYSINLHPSFASTQEINTYQDRKWNIAVS